MPDAGMGLRGAQSLGKEAGQAPTRRVRRCLGRGKSPGAWSRKVDTWFSEKIMLMQEDRSWWRFDWTSSWS